MEKATEKCERVSAVGGADVSLLKKAAEAVMVASAMSSSSGDGHVGTLGRKQLPWEPEGWETCRQYDCKRQEAL